MVVCWASSLAISVLTEHKTSNIYCTCDIIEAYAMYTLCGGVRPQLAWENVIGRSYMSAIYLSFVTQEMGAKNDFKGSFCLVNQLTALLK